MTTKKFNHEQKWYEEHSIDNPQRWDEIEEAQKGGQIGEWLLAIAEGNAYDLTPRINEIVQTGRFKKLEKEEKLKELFYETIIESLPHNFSGTMHDFIIQILLECCSFRDKIQKWIDSTSEI